jgi:hypothetical protein
MGQWDGESHSQRWNPAQQPQREQWKRHALVPVCVLLVDLQERPQAEQWLGCPPPSSAVRSSRHAWLTESLAGVNRPLSSFSARRCELLPRVDQVHSWEQGEQQTHDTHVGNRQTWKTLTRTGGETDEPRGQGRRGTEQRRSRKDEKEGRERAVRKQDKHEHKESQHSSKVTTNSSHRHICRGIEASTIQPRLCGSPPSLPPSYKSRCMLLPSQKLPLPSCHRASKRGSIDSMSMK